MAGRHHRPARGATHPDTDLPVASVMTRPPVTVSAQDVLADAVHQVGPYGHDAYPVVNRRGHVLGLLSLPEAERDPAFNYAMLVADLADRDPELLIEPSHDVAELLDNVSFLRAHHAVVVGPDDEPIGIVAESDILRAIRTHRLRLASPSDYPELVGQS